MRWMARDVVWLRCVAVIEIQQATEALSLDDLARVSKSLIREGDDVVDSLMIALSMVEIGVTSLYITFDGFWMMAYAV